MAIKELKELARKKKIYHNQIARDTGLTRETVTLILGGRQTTLRSLNLIRAYIITRVNNKSKTARLYFLTDEQAEKFFEQRVYERKPK
jgi:hypothetical protein